MKNKGYLFIVIGLCAGLILIFFGGSFSGSSNEASEEKPVKTDQTADYISKLELRVSDIISCMDGISDVRVLITPECTEGNNYAQNDSFSGGELTRNEYVMTDKDGKPILISVEFPKIRGVAVVCRGGSNPIIQQKIISMLCALLDISSTKVYVSG